MPGNVDFVRSIYEQWERGDFDSLGWAHAEIEFVVADGPKPARMRGLRAMLQYWREFLRAWDGHANAVEEYRELDERRVLVLLHSRHSRGNASRLELGRLGGGAAQVFDVRDGMVTRLVTYFNRERALADLGLDESAELVRSAVTAFNQRDVRALEELFADDFELRVIGGLADMTGTEFEGKRAALDWIGDLVDTIGGFLQIETLRRLGDQVLLIARFDTSGAASGAAASWRIGQVYSVRDRQISGLDSYYSADEALRALELQAG